MITLLYLVLLGHFATSLACSKTEYTYQVVDCKEPQIKLLGDYIMQQIQRKPRTFQTTTCFDENMKFLEVSPFRSSNAEFDSKRLAGAWLYKYVHTPELVFAGPEETIQAIQDGRTLNILMDKKLSLHRYVLRNTTDGSIITAYHSDEDLMQRISNEQWWSHLEVLQCENLVYYLSKEFRNQMVSFTVMDKFNSNDELRFILKGGGIGGFYKTDSSDQHFI